MGSIGGKREAAAPETWNTSSNWKSRRRVRFVVPIHPNILRYTLVHVIEGRCVLKNWWRCAVICSWIGLLDLKSNDARVKNFKMQMVIEIRNFPLSVVYSFFTTWFLFWIWVTKKCGMKRYMFEERRVKNVKWNIFMRFRFSREWDLKDQTSFDKCNRSPCVTYHPLFLLLFVFGTGFYASSIYMRAQKICESNLSNSFMILFNMFCIHFLSTNA